MKKYLLLYLIATLVSATAIAQPPPLGGRNNTQEILGGLKVDSCLVLPPTAPFTNKGASTTGRLSVSATDSLPVYSKAGVAKKVLTKFDSGTVYVDAGEVGHANGVASLNSSGIVPSIQLPAITISGQVFIDTSQAQMLGHGSATAGALSVRTDSSSALYVLTQLPSSTRANWHITQGNGVSAFKGRTGAVDPTSGDYTTTLVPEGSNLYYTSARVQGVIGTDTASGALVTTTAMNAAIAAAGTNMGLNAVLANSPNSNRTIRIGKVKSANPYKQITLSVGGADSAGVITVADSAYSNTITLSAGPFIAGESIITGSDGISLSSQAGSSVLTVFSGASTLTEAATGISITGGNGLSKITGLTANKLIGNGSTPSIVAGPGAGAVPTVAISGTDMGGYITVTTGSTPSGSSGICTVTFAIAFSLAPKCILVGPANDQAAQLATNKIAYVNQSSITITTFTLTSNFTGLSALTQYKWFYSVIQ